MWESELLDDCVDQFLSKKKFSSSKNDGLCRKAKQNCHEVSIVRRMILDVSVLFAIKIK